MIDTPGHVGEAVRLIRPSVDLLNARYVEELTFSCTLEADLQPPVPNCGHDGKTACLCKYGQVKNDVVYQHTTVKQPIKGATHFLVDGGWGAVFLFQEIKSQWRLIAIERAFCFG